MDTLLRSVAFLSVAALILCDGSAATTPNQGRVELSGTSFSQIAGGYYSTAANTYLDSGFSNGRTGHSYIQMRLSLRMPRLQPGQEHVAVEGTFFLSDAVSLCREKGYIEKSQLTVRRDGDVYCVSGDVITRSASCEPTGRFRPVSSTATVEICAVEAPDVLPSFNEMFFFLFPERESWKLDLPNQPTENERPE